MVFISPMVLPLAFLITNYTMVSVVERQGWGMISFGRTAFRAKPIGFGGLVGGLAILIPTLLLLAAQQFEFQPTQTTGWLKITVDVTVYLLFAALWEELAFRGYLFTVIRESAGSVWAIGITSVAFALVHAPNSGASSLNLAIVVLAGVFLGLVLIVTKSLYAVWAAHLAWNWVMAGLLHVSVSGNPFDRPGYELVSTGPAWLTGGAWGPEGGIGAAVGLLAGVFYVYGRYLKLGAHTR